MAKGRKTRGTGFNYLTDMKPLIICLLLLTSCTEIDFKKQILGRWVNIDNPNIRIEVKDNGHRMAYRYYFIDYVTDTTYDPEGNIILDTLTAPHDGKWFEADYNEKRGLIYCGDSSRLSYLEQGDGLMREYGKKFKVFLRKKD